MTPNLTFMAAAGGLASAAVLASAFAIFLAQRSFRAATSQPSAPPANNSGELAELTRELETLSQQLRALQRQQIDTPPLLPSGVRRDPSLNVSKRSRAIRMHRVGEPPERIAAELGLSRQEVELLLKVHRLVIAAI